MKPLTSLRSKCLATVEDFYQYGEVVTTKDGVYIYKDNGANILAVAHLDTVQDARHFYTVDIDGDVAVFSTALDDRLGAWVILDVLPKMGLRYDILLTTEEESLNSTAQHFVPPAGKKYNWMFSFDRAGTDVVMYQYDEPEYDDLLEEVNMYKGLGSYSDICELHTLGCAGFNWGCGYENNHTPRSHVIWGNLMWMIDGFVSFYHKHKDRLFASTAGPHWWSSSAWDDGGYGRGWGWDGNGMVVGRDWEGRKVDPDTRDHDIELMNGAERELYTETYVNLRERGWTERDAHDIAMDEVDYFTRKMYGDERDECPICGREECYGLVECGSCHAQVHGDAFTHDHGLCRPCFAKTYPDAQED